MNKKSITITNIDICDFYKYNPQYDIEKNILFIIDFIKNNFNHNVSLDVSLANEMNNNIKMMKEMISNNFKEIKNDIKDNFILIKNELMNKTGLIIDGLNLNDNISNIIKKEIEFAFVKNENVLKDLIPSNKDLLYNHINNLCIDIKNESETNKNSTINLRDYIQNNLNSILLNINNNVDFLHSRFNNVSTKGKVSEYALLNVLMKIYINADIKHIGDTEDSSCDILMERKNKPRILFENKNYDNRVDTKQVNKFKDNIKERGISGIFLSMQSSIVHKNELDLEILGKNILIYIGNVQYDEKIIQFAVEMIDILQPFIDKFNSKDDKYIKILRSSLEGINDEYILFLDQKKDINKCIKSLEDTISELKNKINKLKISKTANLMSALFGSFINAKDEDKEYVCKWCGISYKIEKQLIGHYAQCEIKIAEKKENDIEEDDKEDKIVKKERKKKNINLKGKKVIDNNFKQLDISKEEDEVKEEDVFKEDVNKNDEINKDEDVNKEDDNNKKKKKFINYKNKKK
jgi:hypothetical protein